MPKVDYSYKQRKPFNFDYIKGAFAIEDYEYTYSHQSKDKDEKSKRFEEIYNLAKNPSEEADKVLLPVINNFDNRLAELGLTMKEIPMTAKTPQNAVIDHAYCPMYDESTESLIRIAFVAEDPESDAVKEFVSETEYSLQSDPSIPMSGMYCYPIDEDLFPGCFITDNPEEVAFFEGSRKI